MQPTQIGQLYIDPTRYSVNWQGREVTLRRKEFQILDLLARARGQILTRSDILENVDYCRHRDVFPGSIDVHISRIRKALGQRPDKQVIETVHGVGYRICEG